MVWSLSRSMSARERTYRGRGDAIWSPYMGSGAWHRASSLRERHFRGGDADDAQSAGLPICTAGGCPEGVLESKHDLLAVIDREGFVRECRASDVAAQAFERVALMGSAAGAGRRVGCDGAQRQGAAAEFCATRLRAVGASAAAKWCSVPATPPVSPRAGCRWRPQWPASPSAGPPARCCAAASCPHSAPSSTLRPHWP